MSARCEFSAFFHLRWSTEHISANTEARSCHAHLPTRTANPNHMRDTLYQSLRLLKYTLLSRDLRTAPKRHGKMSNAALGQHMFELSFNAMPFFHA